MQTPPSTKVRDAIPWLVALALLGCGAPKQAPIEDITDEGGLDTGSKAPSSAPPAEGDGDVDPVADEKASMHSKCCTDCLGAFEKDKSGAKPEDLTCADLTVDLSPWCLEHFRDNPTKISECTAGDAPEPEPEEDGPPG